MRASLGPTERDESADAALKESEARLRALVEGIPQLVWRATGQGAWTWSSPQWSAFTGLSEEASRGLGWLGAVHPADRPQAVAAWKAAVEVGAFSVEYRLRHAASGADRWFATRASPIRDSDGRILEWLGTSTDIDELRRLQEHQKALLAELQHRVRNTLSVVRSIARRTAETSASLDDYTAHFDGRLSAFARTQAVVTRDPRRGVDFACIVREELAAHATKLGRQLRVEGPELRLKPKAAETLGLAVHELAINAVKYGALSSPHGRIEVAWSVEPGHGDPCRLRFSWQESGLRKPLAPPERRGFGTELIERSLAYDLGARSRLEIRREGARCTIELPLTDAVAWSADAVV
jgi:PAS domain S-box-containing protein